MESKISIWALEWNKKLLDRIDLFNRVGLSNGISGVILYNLVLFHSNKNKNHLSICIELVNKIIEKLEEIEPEGLFLADLTEACYVIRLLIEEPIEEKIELKDLLQSLEELMIELGLQYLSNQLLDPYTGAFNSVNYFTYHKINNELIKESFEKIKELAYENQKPRIFKTEFSQDHIYISITHGLSFFLKLLCDDQYNKDQNEVKNKLIEYWFHEIMQQLKEPKDDASWLPEYFDGIHQTRICLAYGDLGTLYALKIAAQKINQSSNQELISKAFKRTAKRSIKIGEQISDNSLLYGAGGILMYYNKLSRSTKEKDFIEAERFWAKQTKIKLTEEFTEIERNRFNSKKSCFMEGITGSLSCYLMWSEKNEFITRLYFPFYIT